MSNTKTQDGDLNVYPISNYGTSIDWFTAQLENHKIDLHDHSVLALSLKQANLFKDIAELRVPFKSREIDDFYDFFSTAYGVDFLTKTIHRGVESGVILDRQRWRHLVTCDPIINAN